MSIVIEQEYFCENKALYRELPDEEKIAIREIEYGRRIGWRPFSGARHTVWSGVSKRIKWYCRRELGKHVDREHILQILRTLAKKGLIGMEPLKYGGHDGFAVFPLDNPCQAVLRIMARLGYREFSTQEVPKVPLF